MAEISKEMQELEEQLKEFPEVFKEDTDEEGEGELSMEELEEMCETDDEEEDEIDPGFKEDPNSLKLMSNLKEEVNKIDETSINFFQLMYDLDRASIIYPIYRANVDLILKRFPISKPVSLLDVSRYIKQYKRLVRLANRWTDSTLSDMAENIQNLEDEIKGGQENDN